jgi:cell shape-determining protein MreC
MRTHPTQREIEKKIQILAKALGSSSSPLKSVVANMAPLRDSVIKAIRRAASLTVPQLKEEQRLNLEIILLRCQLREIEREIEARQERDQ